MSEWKTIESAPRDGTRVLVYMRRRRGHATVVAGKKPSTAEWFTCGEGGEKGADGLPSQVFVCPMFGLSGFAVYTKTKDYSEPGY